MTHRVSLQRRAIEIDAKAGPFGDEGVGGLEAERLAEQIVLADHSPENVGRPRATFGGSRMMKIHGLENAQIDLRAMEAKEVRGRCDRVQLLALSETRVEVEAVDRAVSDQVRGIVDALPLRSEENTYEHKSLMRIPN